MDIEKINNFKFKLPQSGTKRKKPILGYDLFNMYTPNFPNVFLVGKKASGKSTVIYNILDNCINEDTYTFIFSNTFYNDQIWKDIANLLNKKQIQYEAHLSMFEEKNNILAEILNNIESYAKELQMIKNNGVNKLRGIKTPTIITEENTIQKKKSSKYAAPMYCFVFDDFSSELRNPILAKLLKQNRHYHAFIIISSQYFKDIKPEIRMQINYYLLFKNIDEKRLIQIYEDSSLTIRLDKFLSYYKKVTEDLNQKDKHNNKHFLYVNTDNPELRIDFNYNIKL